MKQRQLKWKVYPKKRFEKFSQGGAKKEGVAESWLENASGGAYMKRSGKYFTVAEPLSRDYLFFFSAFSHRGLGPMPYGPEAARSAMNAYVSVSIRPTGFFTLQQSGKLI